MNRCFCLRCSFDPFLRPHTIHHPARRITAKDTKAGGIPWLFAPILGINTQPLWSRSYETFGECPYVAAEMGKAIIQGPLEEWGNPRVRSKAEPDSSPRTPTHTHTHDRHPVPGAQLDLPARRGLHEALHRVPECGLRPRPQPHRAGEPHG